MTARALVVAALLVAATATAVRAEPTGSALPGLGAYDELMEGLIRKWDVAGASLAVARGDKLMLARGYGLANREKAIRVEPTSLFRLASLSKTVTAVAVLKAVQDGRLELDDKVVPILGDLGPRAGRITDTRVADITVRHLLQHSAGFDRDRSGDVVFMPWAADAAKRQRGPLPPDCPTILRDALERKLDFTPGERFAYSNIGYCILGRVVERVAGTPYEIYVRQHVLSPVGATRMKVGRTLDAADGEVTYYDHRGAKDVRAMPGLGLTSGPRPYGNFAMETMDSYGGWIGSTVDYLRFVLALDGRRGGPLLDRATLAAMNAPSALKATASGDDDVPVDGAWYGLGVRVRRLEAGVNLWHSGSLPGTSTMAVRTADGLAWVVAFNGRPEKRSAFRRELELGLHAATKTVKRWPDGDLFATSP